MSAIANKNTFENLCAVEPGLARLLRRARMHEPTMGFCANEIWYWDLKPQLVRLVGFEADHPELSSSADYDLAYQTIYEALPDCDHPGEMCRG